MLHPLFRLLTRSHWPAWLWTFLILVLCTLPGKKLPEGPPISHFDKLVHIGLFIVWTLLWCLARPRHRYLIIAAGIMYGIFLEYYQQWLPFDRSFDWWDALADAAGVAAGYLLFLLLNRYSGMYG